MSKETTPPAPGSGNKELSKVRSETAGAAGAGDSPPGLKHFVSELKSIEDQVGQHVISALKHEGTVAVLTAVLPAGGASGERIASVPLDQALWTQVQDLLMSAGEEQAQDVPCIGFQCVLQDRQREAEQEKQKSPPPDNF